MTTVMLATAVVVTLILFYGVTVIYIVKLFDDFHVMTNVIQNSKGNLKLEIAFWQNYKISKAFKFSVRSFDDIMSVSIFTTVFYCFRNCKSLLYFSTYNYSIVCMVNLRPYIFICSIDPFS